MTFLFDNPSFAREALRTAGYARYGGADLGEMLATAREIPDGDERAWHDQWKALAERLRILAAGELAAGHRITARDALLRACGYYRAAQYYLRADPAEDPEVALLGRRIRETFAGAATLFDHPAERLTIPDERTGIPAYLFLADDSGAQRPTIIYHGGYDAVLEEGYFAVAAAALSRGYHCLIFDGPGQGALLREQRLTFRPDWETVVGAVVDNVVMRSEVDIHRLVLVGAGFGGYLAARATAFDHRFAASILHGAVFDAHETGCRILPPGVADAAMAWQDEEVAAALVEPMTRDTHLRWFIHNGLWAFGCPTPAALIRIMVDYTLLGVAEEISCPTLLLETENDPIHRGESARVARAMTCERRRVLLTDTESAPLGFHRHAFGWLDTILAR
jgi:alpha-beta hydrolase superfamily lysophospholipase